MNPIVQMIAAKVPRIATSPTDSWSTSATAVARADAQPDDAARREQPAGDALDREPDSERARRRDQQRRPPARHRRADDAREEARLDDRYDEHRRRQPAGRRQRTEPLNEGERQPRLQHQPGERDGEIGPPPQVDQRGLRDRALAGEQLDRQQQR